MTRTVPLALAATLVSGGASHRAIGSPSPSGRTINQADQSQVVDLDRVGNPNWSPKGDWIAFTGTIDDRYALYLVRPDGSGLHSIVIDDLTPRWPSWSPDGEWLAFAGSPTGGMQDNDLFIVRTNGRDLRRLTEGARRHVGLVGWSPLGDEIAYYTPVGEDWHVYSVRIDTGEERRLTRSAGRHVVPSWSADANQLLLSANRGGHSDDIWTHDLTSGAWNQLTHTEATESAPRRSPDRSWISFESDADGDWELYLMRSDGSGTRQLTFNTSFDAMMTWSPDGSTLAYECQEETAQRICFLELATGRVTPLVARSLSGCGAPIAFLSQRHGLRDSSGELLDDVYIMNADGSGVTRMMGDTPAELLPNWLPKWAPDGKSVVFDSPRSGNRELYRYFLASRRMEQLTHNDWDDFLPAFSSDGSRIAYTSQQHGNLDVFVLDLGSAQKTRVTDRDSMDWFPTWSPDGTAIAFNTDRDGDHEIYSIQLATGVLSRLTENSGEDRFPHWSPDGEWVLFRRGEAPQHADDEIYMVRADGSQEVRLTESDSEDSDPSWTPDGRRVVFHSRRTGAQEFFVLDLESRELTQLTDSGVRDAHGHVAVVDLCVQDVR